MPAFCNAIFSETVLGTWMTVKTSENGRGMDRGERRDGIVPRD